MTCTDVELVDTTRCPTCGAPVREHGWAQPALFYFGGYGATVLRTSRRCSGCGWALPYDERSLNPRNDQRAPIATAENVYNRANTQVPPHRANGRGLTPRKAVM